MSKYLFIDGEDYAAVTFEQDFKGSRAELWDKANEAKKTQWYEDGDEVAFAYEALELDDKTVEQMQNRMDYDDSKHANYFKVDV